MSLVSKFIHRKLPPDHDLPPVDWRIVDKIPPLEPPEQNDAVAKALERYRTDVNNVAYHAMQQINVPSQYASSALPCAEMEEHYDVQELDRSISEHAKIFDKKFGTADIIDKVETAYARAICRAVNGPRSPMYTVQLAPLRDLLAQVYATCEIMVMPDEQKSGKKMDDFLKQKIDGYRECLEATLSIRLFNALKDEKLVAGDTKFLMVVPEKAKGDGSRMKL